MAFSTRLFYLVLAIGGFLVLVWAIALLVLLPMSMLLVGPKATLALRPLLIGVAVMLAIGGIFGFQVLRIRHTSRSIAPVSVQCLAAFGGTSQPRRWTVTAPLERVVRLHPIDQPPPTTVQVECALTPDESTSGWVLEIQLVGSLLLIDAARCEGRLVNPGGAMVGQAMSQNHRLTFLLSENQLASLDLVCDYFQGETEHIQFSVSVTPPDLSASDPNAVEGRDLSSLAR